MNKNINFTNKNLSGEIVQAKVRDLITNREYKLESKSDRKTGKDSHCLFAPEISVQSVKGRSYLLKFRIDFNDFRGGDPTLDLEVYNDRDNKISVIENIHHTKKTFESNVGKLVYNIRNKSIGLNADTVIVDFEFQLEMTRTHTMTTKGNIKT